MVAAAVLAAGISNIVAQATPGDYTFVDNIVRFSGVVTDPAGAAVPGAIVTFYPGQPSNAVVVTDREGRYQMDIKRPMGWTGNVAPYQYFIVQETNRNLAFISRNGWQGSNLNVQLQPGTDISITVKDGAGKPIPGAVGELSPMVGNSTGSSGTPLRPDLVSDAEGRMEMKAFPRGHGISLVIKAEGRGLKFLSANEAQTDVENYRFPDVVFETADKEVSGKVVDETGNPVPGANVTVSSGNGPVGGTADEQGRFKVTGVTGGPFNIRANVNGSSGNTSARGGDTNVVIHLGRLASAPPPFVEGTVTDPSGRPAAHVRVELVPLNRWDIYTDADGHYRIDLPAGMPGAMFSWCIYAQDKEHNLAVLQWLDRGSTHVDLQLKQGVTLTAKFQDEQGHPVADSRASLLVLAGNDRYVLDPALEMDATGVIRAVAAPAGQRIAMEVKARGLGTESLEPDPRETVGKALFEFPDVVMKTARLIVSGRVVDENENPIAQVTIFAQGPNQPGDRTHSDENGRFAMHEIMEGDVRLQAGISTSALGYHSTTVTTRAGDTNVVIRLPLHTVAATPKPLSTLKISGTVTDGSGVPVAGVVVGTVPPTAELPEAVTDRDGKYSLEWRVEKSVVGNPLPMRIMARDLAGNRVAVAEIEEDTKDLALEPGLDINGAVVQKTGEAVAGASIELSMTISDPANRPMTLQVLRKPVTVDERGNYDIRALPREWAYNFRVSAADYATVTTSARVEEKSGREATLPPIQMLKIDQWIAGIVVDTNGKPVRDVTIQVRDQGLPNMNAYTDDEGRFKLRVREGPLTVFAICNPIPSGVPTQARLGAKGGDTNLVLHLQSLALPAALQNRGRGN